jgi:outer membrane protein
MMEKNIAFRDEAKRLLDDAKAQLMQPLHQQLHAALRAIGKERSYAFILNTDGNTLPYINSEQGEDVTAAVIAYLTK